MLQSAARNGSKRGASDARVRARMRGLADAIRRHDHLYSAISGTLASMPRAEAARALGVLTIDEAQLGPRIGERGDHG